jgi:enoyl-CoA hydratase/carnithine racemase
MFDSIGQEGLNALNVAVAEQFEQLCERLVAQRSIRVLMLSGNGRAFMAGGAPNRFAAHRCGGISQASYPSCYLGK